MAGGALVWCGLNVGHGLKGLEDGSSRWHLHGLVPDLVGSIVYVDEGFDLALTALIPAKEHPEIGGSEDTRPCRTSFGPPLQRGAGTQVKT